MDTYFAKAERAKQKDLIAKIEIINNNPVMSGFLHSIGGLLAVLDEHRQILAVNDAFLETLGINDPSEYLGLRPGETLQCVHAYKEPAGCGTTKFCSTCGAAIAIVSSLGEDKPVERICALTAKRGDHTVDMALLVRSQPINVDDRKFLLLFLQDITLQQQRAALERTFFHDINNMLTGLIGASEMLYLENRQSNFTKTVLQMSSRLRREVEMQRSLLQSESYTYHPLRHEITTKEIQEEIESFFLNHPAAHGKKIQFSTFSPALGIKTDISLLLRVVSNMIVNALESTKEKGTIKVWSEKKDNFLSICVWNEQSIPEDIAQRIFQRNFSTKSGEGRGVGTYSMKLFGEQILGGKVSFVSSQKEGTVFRLSLPL
ncbi:MAG: sensor histidine kinase [Thermodesulfobacteriota bacterium]|nr:sensor histidine kinase [Thermodesulfobacteriota bacterium]